MGGSGVFVTQQDKNTTPLFIEKIQKIFPQYF